MKQDANPKNKDRPATEEALLEAVGEIVREGGFAALGVNAVAERAGVSKVLIYRYFGDFDALVEAWALKNNIFGNEALALPEGLGPKDLVGALASAQIQALRFSPESREVLRWFLAAENPLSAKVMAQLETKGRALHNRLSPQFPKNVDTEAAAALLVGGIYYLCLIADRVDVFNGVDLSSEEGWKRVTQAARRLAAGLLFEGDEILS